MAIKLVLTMPFFLQVHTCEVYEGESVGAWGWPDMDEGQRRQRERKEERQTDSKEDGDELYILPSITTGPHNDKE